MDIHTGTRGKVAFKSQIPVLANRPKSSNLSSKENKHCASSSSSSQTLKNNKTRVELRWKCNSQIKDVCIVKTKSITTKNKCLVSETSNINKVTASNFHSSKIKNKEESNKCLLSRTSNINKDASNFHSSKIKTTEKSNKCLVSRTSNVNKNASNFHSCKIKNTEKSNKCLVSRTSNINKDAPNFRNSKIKTIEKSNQPEKYLNSKMSSKNKFSCTVNTQVPEKVNSNLIKNKMLSTPQNIFEKENKKADDASYFSSQKDIKFEVNEFSRLQILSRREPSPNKMPDIRQRSSIYQKFQVHPNPVQEVLQAIADMTARRASRNMSTQQDKSRIQDRNSFYTPCNPKEEVMRSLEALKARRMMKSALKSTKKKVTFNLHVEEIAEKLDCDSKPIPSTDTENRLTQIDESRENTPNSPEKNEVEIGSQESTQLLPHSQESCVQVKAGSSADNTREPIKENFTKFTTTTIDRDIGTKLCVLPIEVCSIKKINPVACTQKTFNDQRTTGILLEKNTRDQRVEKSLTKLCTPRPISLYSNSRFLNDSLSPELFVGKTLLTSLAPLYTPLALKNMAKTSAASPDADLNPVRLKLDFTTAENDSPVKENIVKKHTIGNLKRINTVQAKLDDLADKECRFFLSNESISVVCGRHLQNPVAVTLTDGDEMHFLPVRL